MRYLIALTCCALCANESVGAKPTAADPLSLQQQRLLTRLQSNVADERAGAAEALGFLRATNAEDALMAALNDPSELVRRQAAMALAWCGRRRCIPLLIQALDDSDWATRQSAHVALVNLSGLERSFDALAPPAERDRVIAAWRRWFQQTQGGCIPEETLGLIAGAKPWLNEWSVTASSTYKGPASVLTDGAIGPGFWQTKNVPFPQSCVIDMAKVQDVSEVTVYQYGPQFVMTEYEVATSLNGKTFDVVERKKEESPVTLVVRFKPRPARYVRITSYSSVRSIYPTTFFEVRINQSSGSTGSDSSVAWRLERGLRALGTLGGPGTTELILKCLGDAPPASPDYLPMARAGIRALGRLKEEAGFQYLVRLLQQPFWARYAAEALGDFGDPRAVMPLLAAYPRYAKDLKAANPPDVPQDDKMTFPSEDRMLETPYAIIYALCRLPLNGPDTMATLGKLAPLLTANLPGDHDAIMLYEPEVGHLLTRYLLNRCGVRQQACEHVFATLGQPRRVSKQDESIEWPVFKAYRMASMLPTVCTEKEDIPRLAALLDHPEGWVRINAAKTLAWIGDPSAIEPIGTRLTHAKAEADFGFNATFKNEEFDDPAPRWREALIRALGLLHAHQYTHVIATILDDEKSVVEVRRAAAQALGDLGNPEAIDVLRHAALHHSFYSIRHVARDALRVKGVTLPETDRVEAEPVSTPVPTPDVSPRFKSLIFIQGSNSIPNTIGTVEQADRWRQTYVVTDSGPVYRPGRNLYRLSPPRPDGTVTPVTQFDGGYVGDLEIAWDASHVLFTHREENDPWWHVYRINVDGTGLKQLTHGPYHDVGPVYLPDGRIVFSTSRAGIRDEYHGYPCTALWVMNADGGDMHPIATNIGRDNEPAILNDGRVVFSRLEVFYSRNKTELTVHAVAPDGTRDRVLYGPERRLFWRQLDHGPRTPADGQENPLTHRVLRMSQPQPMPNSPNIVVVTQGGLTLIGTRRDGEQIITPDNKTRAYTTPFPLPDGRLLCAATEKVADRTQVDLGLYLFDPVTGDVELVYNDPAVADFEARPVMARKPPRVIASVAKRNAYTGQFICSSVYLTQEAAVRERGRLVRLVEGMPVPQRHSTQTNPWDVWKNHGGTFARVLGTAPLAADGSFSVRVPADRLMHFQILDSNRRVVGNQKTWIYPRPGERKSCVGCHENPHATATYPRLPLAASQPPIDFLPSGDEFSYRAKAWFKGHLPEKIDERTRTVRAVNLLAR